MGDQAVRVGQPRRVPDQHRRRLEPAGARAAREPPMTRRASLAFAGPSLIAMAILAGLAAFSPEPMRAVIAVPLALLLPGYTIIRLLPRTRLGSDPVPLLAMSFVLSMTSYPLLGLVLYGLGVRMSQTSVVVAL